MPQEDKIAVIVATITDDVRLFDVPKLRVAALKFTETARARIVKVRVAESSNRAATACCGAWVGVQPQQQLHQATAAAAGGGGKDAPCMLAPPLMVASRLQAADLSATTA